MPLFRRSDTPLEIAAKGALAGFGATILLSLLSRATFGVMEKRSERRSGAAAKRSSHPSVITPGGALALPSDAGPESSAGKFAMKVGAGLFDRDLSRHAAFAGEAVHFVYGTFWGAIFGLVYASR